MSLPITAEDKARIRQAIIEAEQHTSGEIKVHIERHCPGENVMGRAATLFHELALDRTTERNGVLFYLATEDRLFAILGDVGISGTVPDDFWDQIKVQMQSRFRSGDFCQGLCEGIAMAGQELKAHFPGHVGGPNQISDEVSVGH